jgi:hypothetical protein
MDDRKTQIDLFIQRRKVMSNLFSGNKDFHALSLKDLLEARDFYHVHLMNKENVVATAVGRYLIRKDDPWPEHKKELDIRERTREPKEERTLQNSEMRYYSWPCILVFVDRWVREDQFAKGINKISPQEMIPKTLYLPDGRTVPVCVVKAPKSEEGRFSLKDWIYPKNKIGGGYPVLTSVQGEERAASIGCLVTDGHLVYALTNRHVSGAPEEKLYTLLAGLKKSIGKSSDKQLTKLPFQKVYPGWQGEDVYVNLDIGLIEITQKKDWTAQVYGIGTLGEVADFNTHNLSLRLIGQPVRAFGCASRLMLGEISALFYRYKALSGYEYVADYMIGPRKGIPFQTHYGDSGTVWLLEFREDRETSAGRKVKSGRLRPLAVQWGGQVLQQQSFALATCLSTVCKLLDVEVVRDFNVGMVEYWGAIGHYWIGNKAWKVIANERLKGFMELNRQQLSFEAEEITPAYVKEYKEKAKEELEEGKGFIPLTDVADIVWKEWRVRANKENPNHYADIDQKNRGGKTLLQMFQDDQDSLNVETWRDFYESVEVRSNKQGLLPFRVWQIYKKMVEYVTKKQRDEFLCAAGILLHYVGDACNPLHLSCLSDGYPNSLGKGNTGNKKTKKKGQGVHSAYENDMLINYSDEIMRRVDDLLAEKGSLKQTVRGGKNAGIVVMKLMKSTLDTLKPEVLVDAYVKRGKKSKTEALWEVAQEGTVKVIAEGCRYWAMLCDNAWEEGRADEKGLTIGEVGKERLIELYMDQAFLPSLTLANIKSEL